MKGVSSIVAVVLILLITIALAGMAYIWFTSVFGAVTESAGETVERSTEQFATNFALESASYNCQNSVQLSVRNVGTSNIDATAFAVYLSGTLATITGGNTGTVSVNQVRLLTASNSTIGAVCGKSARVTLPGVQLTTSVACTRSC